MTQESKQQIINLLQSEQCSCVIRKGDTIRIFRKRGVQDLYRLLKDDTDFLKGAFVADKVVGKAAAALMILGGVEEVFTFTVSRLARDLFERSAVKLGFAQEVPHIINRAGTGWCPMESRCRDLDTPEACFGQVEEFLNTMKENK